MSIWSLTDQQSVFKCYHSDKHFSQFLPTRWRQKWTWIDMQQNYITVTRCINVVVLMANDLCWNSRGSWFLGLCGQLLSINHLQVTFAVNERLNGGDLVFIQLVFIWAHVLLSLPSSRLWIDCLVNSWNIFWSHSSISSYFFYFCVIAFTW